MAQVAARLVHAQEVGGASPPPAMTPKLKGERLFVKQREVGSSPTGVAIEHGSFTWEPTPFTWMFETRPYLGWYGKNALLAQWIEHGASTSGVVGSSPTEGADFGNVV